MGKHSKSGKKRRGSWKGSNSRFVSHQKELDAAPVRPGDKAISVIDVNAKGGWRPSTLKVPEVRVPAAAAALPEPEPLPAPAVVPDMTPAQALNADPPTAEPWNTRYLEYARAHDCSPGEMLRRDVGMYPGGKMAGFILWIGARWAEWRTKFDMATDAPISKTHHEVFDGWLKSWVDGHTVRIIRQPQKKLVTP